MVTRIISAAVAIAIFIGVVYFAPPICFSIAVSVLMAVAAYELVWRSGIAKSRSLLLVSCVSAALTPVFVSVDSLSKYAFVLAFALMVLIFTIWLLNYGKVSLVMVLASFFAGFVIPLMFSMLIRLRALENGEFVMLLPLIAAWMTDTGAYFVGTFLGRHKLCEKISPKKTVEGAIGGVITCAISFAVFGKLMETYFSSSVNYPMLIVSALVLSCLAQIGDLSFSLIKREYNIKDYGVLIPGHGGVIDRFDSTIFTIPASYILLVVIGGII